MNQIIYMYIYIYITSLSYTAPSLQSDELCGGDNASWWALDYHLHLHLTLAQIVTKQTDLHISA